MALVVGFAPTSPCRAGCVQSSWNQLDYPTQAYKPYFPVRLPLYKGVGNSRTIFGEPGWSRTNDVSNVTDECYNVTTNFDVSKVEDFGPYLFAVFINVNVFTFPDFLSSSNGISHISQFLFAQNM